MPHKRKLIEVALPLEAISAEASLRKRKAPAGYPTTLHRWWAQRPPAACRAVLFASLVDDPSSDPDRFPTPKTQEEERRRLFGIIERLVLWENTTNEAVLEEARAEILRSTSGNPPTLLDPFCGGGTIPLEAQRLGIEAHASDLNPVAVLITKALIEIPPKFAGCPPVHPDARRGVGATGTWKGAAGLAEDIRSYGAWMRDEAERRIGHLYPKVRVPNEQGGGQATVVAWLWARTVTCPNPACGASMPLVRSFALSARKGKEAWVEPIIDRAVKTVRFALRTGVPSATERSEIVVGTGFTSDKGKKVQAAFRCVVCRSGVARGEYIDIEANAGRMGAQLMAVVADGQHGRLYVAPSDEQLVAPETAFAMIEEPQLAAKLPTEPARGTFASNAQGRIYGFIEFKDYFTPRQLVALTTFSDLVGEARDRVQRDALAAGLSADPTPLDGGGAGANAYADAIATYLAFATDRHADYGNSLASWRPKDSAMRALFARQGIPMVWDFSEASPFGASSGGFAECAGVVARTLEYLAPAAYGHALQADAVAPSRDSLRQAISTDPPYYSNVGYADLADFFYVWLRRSLSSVYPGLFATVLTPKSAELVATPYRFDGSKKRAEAHFESGLEKAFGWLHTATDPDVPVTVYYAFKQSESEGDEDGSIGTVSTGWETMLGALLRSGLTVVGTWPMRTEGDNRQVSVGTNALASSIVLVCRPRRTDSGVTSRKDFVACLKSELPEALRTLQHGNIAPVDLAQASIGPGMAVFSRYAKVLEPDGSEMRVRTALALINQALDEILAEQDGEFDADTRWAIAWYEQFGLETADSGRAILLTQAKNTSLGGLQAAGIIDAPRGKTRLLARSEYSTVWDPAKDTRLPVWEATQRLVQALLEGGEGAAAEMQAKLGGLGEQARDLAYRLYQVAGRKGWTDEARAYNALVVAWPDLLRGAERVRVTEPSQPSLGLE